MSVWFVSRHPGAIAWAHQQGLAVDHWVTHLDTEEVAAGDTVLGTLPMHAAAAVCARGARYFTLDMQLTESARGRELTEDDLKAFSCTLREVHVAYV